MSSQPKLGFSGRVAAHFLTTEITPLLALVGLLLGLLAVMVTPREEEPQINVTFANLFIPFPGASAREVESLVSTPAEQVLSEIEGVKHVYSISNPGMSIITVQYLVGEDRTSAILRLYNAIYSNQDWLPQNLGVGQPIIKPKGIDDVPIVTLTLWSEDENITSYDLQKVAHAIEVELKRVKGTRDIYTLGSSEEVVHVALDAVALAAYGIALDDLRRTLQLSNSTQPSGALVADNQEILVQAGTFLSTLDELKTLVVGVHDGRPVYLQDVATISRGPEQLEKFVWFGAGPAAASKAISTVGEHPSVTIAIAKQPGTNAVDVANQVVERFAHLKGIFVPDGVEATVTRNYGETANAKAEKLITKLIFATASVVALVFFFLGWREAFIVGMAVVITLAITLFASWAWGFTLNRVSLFALIFSIGILVDDAIVVVENIHRHMQMGGKKLLEVIPQAVDEVGGPTILATFTVIAALLPMAFVSGLMGPYMSPIPINASIGMLISLAVAFVITPWMANRFLKLEGAQHLHGVEAAFEERRLYRFFHGVMHGFLRQQQGSRRRWLLMLFILVLIGLSLLLVVNRQVVLKMLPFDNKSEFQVVVDLPEGSSLEQTTRVLSELAAYLREVPEVTDYQVYSGTAAPINFNGLVRQYYLREGAHLGDIQVNLTEQKLRQRKSHEIATAVRPVLQTIGDKYGANVKVVEVPPGPPVLSPLVAEIYGLDYEGQIAVAKEVRQILAQTPDVVDIDDSVEAASPKWILRVDQKKAALMGVSQQAIVTAVAAVLGGEDASYLHDPHKKYPLPIRMEFAVAHKSDIEQVLALRLRSEHGTLVPLSELVVAQMSHREHSIHHKDLQEVVYVVADSAGKLDSPLYAMFNTVGSLRDNGIPGNPTLEQYFINPPAHPYDYSVKWDGEWQITFETFRDMGLAYSIGLLMIYLLVVAQFRSYVVPLIIMAPIPLTLIGVMPGHALAGLQFTATSMIGMIALAGIIVRNSILLVDFINQQVTEGVPFERAVINSGAVRAKPIMLTGVAAMMGAFFILDDPIFSGLAISLISGIFVSTILTLVVIPVMYYAFMYKRFATK
ncbi:MAG: efflux RND transporter permease subunit [Gammaproteobacteria bacterium]|nr:efflux RND transporter permease subunit [Gammaproteobacteria bacterium]